MRIWLNPAKLQGYGARPAAVLNAVRAQNVQFAAGSIGSEPVVAGQGITATVTAKGAFTLLKQFGRMSSCAPTPTARRCA